MSIGNFGINRPADVLIDDVEIFYTYSPDRENVSNETFRLDPTVVLQSLANPDGEEVVGEENLMEGLYNITLPSSDFNQVGIYNVYIRPKVIPTQIVDCGVLSSLPTIKGIVLDGNALPSNLINNNALQGYRVEYLNTDGSKRRNFFRIVTSSNKTIPVTENIGNTSQTAVRYRFDDSGTLLFLQLTPSSASSSKPNQTPILGSPDQKIRLINTSFNPIMMEIELVENTTDSLANIIAGNQIRDVQKGIVTHYDANNNIVAQFNVYDIEEDDTKIFEIKEKRQIIDESQDFQTITDSVNET